MVSLYSRYSYGGESLFKGKPVFKCIRVAVSQFSRYSCGDKPVFKGEPVFQVFVWW